MHKKTLTAFILIIASALSVPEAAPATGPVGGFAMPSLEDERETYRRFGRTWSAAAEPNHPSAPGYVVSDPDIHGDTEGDDLWSYLMMYRRTGQRGYLDRAAAWVRYFKEDMRACKGEKYSSFCYDRDGFLLDHLYGWGLVAWYEHAGDAAALAEAESLLVQAEAYWSKRVDGGYPVPGRFAMAYYGLRGPARHLHLAVRVAEATGKQRWADLRDRLIDLWLRSPDWDERGMYFLGDWSTDQNLGAGAHARGDRIMGSFQVGVLTEAFAQAWRATGKAQLKERMIAMARFVDRHGLDSAYLYTASTFGIVGGRTWHSYSAQEPVTYWDGVYTTSLVNTLAWGWHHTGEAALRQRAFFFWERGNKSIYGEPVKRTATDASMDHFADSRFATSSGNFYLDHNKGELQYTWALFANTHPGASPSPPPGAPRGAVSARRFPGGILLALSGQGRAGTVRAATLLDRQGRLVADLSRRITRGGDGRLELAWHSDPGTGVYILRLAGPGGSTSHPFFLGK